MSKKTESTFEKDDFVVYPTHGVGRILGTERRDVGGSTLEMLVVRFEHDRMTLRVPLEKARSPDVRSARVCRFPLYQGDYNSRFHGA